MSLKDSIPNFENFKQQFEIAFASYLTNKSVEIVDKVIDDLLSADSMCFTQPFVGAIWMSKTDGMIGLNNGIISSYYFNKEYKHYSITKGSYGRKTSVANAGEWAICQQTKSRWGNKTGYHTDIPEEELKKMNNPKNNHYGVFCNVDDGMQRKVVNGYFVGNYM